MTAKLELQLSDGPFERSFKDWGQLLTFLNNARSDLPKTQARSPLLDTQRALASMTASIINQNQRDIPFSDQNVASFVSNYEGLRFLPQSRDGRFLNQIFEQYGSNAAGRASAYLVDGAQLLSMETRESHLVYNEVLRHFRKGKAPSLRSAENRLEKQNKRMDEILIAGEERIEAAIADIQGHHKKERKRDKAQQRRWTKVMVGSARQAATVIESRINAIDATRDAYDEHMKIRAAVVYWQQKAADHETKAGTAGASMFLFLVLASIILVIAAVAALNGQLSTPGRDTNGILAIGFLGALVSFGIIGARLLSWNYRREVQAGEDARQRAAMAKTFLALIKDQAIEADDRAMILEALFRPAGSGDTGSSNSVPTSPAALAAMIALARPTKGGGSA